MKVRIRLDTITEIGNFVLAVTTATSNTEPVYVTDGKRMCVNGKSFMGLVHAREFDVLYCECERDISRILYPFIPAEIVGEESHE